MSLHLVNSPHADERPRSGPQRHVPFSEHLGLRLERSAGGEAEVSLDLRPELLDNNASAHGGVVMTLLDSAMANAALARIGHAREVVTVDMHVAFMRPTSGRLLARGRATGGGRSICFCEAAIVDAAGEVVAQAIGTFRYREPA